MILPLANILQPLIDVADSVIKFFHDDVGFSWGIAIIALTFTVRVAVLPLSLRGIRSMRRMQLVAPRSRHYRRSTRTTRSAFNARRWSLQGGGRQPLLVVPPVHPSVPVFIAIYQLLRGDTFQADVTASPPPGFLFVKSVIEAPQGAELIVLIVLCVTTTAASVLLTTATTPTASPAQRYLMLLFPLIIVPFIINAPAGLAVYWITTNLFSLGQQWIVNRVMPAPAPATPEEIKETKAPPPPPRKKKFKRR